MTAHHGGFSQGYENFLFSITNKLGPGAVTSRFPRGICVDRIPINQCPARWLFQVIDEKMDGKADPCEIDEGMAVISTLAIENGNVVYANIHVWVAGIDKRVPLSKLRIEQSLGHSYFRLDYDLSKPGNSLNHPVPHIHVLPNEGARFSTELGPNGNFLGGFFDFLYRNFFYDQWRMWSKTRCETLLREKGMDPDLFETIERACREGKTKFLIDQASEYRAVRQCLREGINNLPGPTIQLHRARELDPSAGQHIGAIH